VWARLAQQAGQHAIVSSREAEAPKAITRLLAAYQPRTLRQHPAAFGACCRRLRAAGLQDEDTNGGIR
jgi:hypothetical protein